METKIKRNLRPVFVTLFLLAASLFFTFLVFRTVDPSPFFSTNILLLTLMNVNIILTVVLVLLLSRNLIKFFFERREGPMKFKSKLVAAFLGLSLVPSVLLFIVAGGLLTSSIDNWFSIQVERSLVASLTVAQQYYTQAQDTTKQAAQQIGGELAVSNSDPIRLRLREAKEAGDLLAVHLVTPDKLFIASTWPEEESREGESFPISFDFFKKGLAAKKPMTMIQGDFNGQLIRTVFPILMNESSFESSLPVVLVVDKLIPSSLIGEMNTIQRELEAYKELKQFKNPIKGSYLLSFFIVVLVIIFSATWFGFYLARGITGPIARLAAGTDAVAQGNLDIQIEAGSNDEIGVLVTSFNKMTHDLKQSREALVRAQKIATWQEVALQMAHEIKNPLTPIRLSAERLRKKREEDAPDFDRVFEESTQMILNEVDGLSTLVNAFSQFARLPAPDLVLQSIDPIVAEMILLYQFRHQEMTFQSDLDENVPLLRLDREQMKRVFINLFENAVEAMRQGSPDGEVGGTLLLTTSYDRGCVTISVEDEGRGIASDDFDKIFLPSFSRKKGGSGLGLAIVHRIVLDHGGRIVAAPRHPKGTIFTIELPVAV